MRSAMLFCFIIIFSSIGLKSFCQQVKAGYYITAKGDTVRGRFLYRQWQHNPGIIEFKNGERSVSLRPSDTREVHIEGFDTYISYKGTRLLNPSTLLTNMTEVDSTNRFDTVTVFLRLLYSYANVKLLLYEDAARSNFYLQQGGHIQELIHKAYTGGAGIIYQPVYRAQLLVAFEKLVFDKGFLKELEQLSYKEKDLVRFLEKLSGVPRIKKQKAYPGKLIAEAGVSINHIAHLNPGVFPEANATYKNAISPVAAIGYIFYNQRSFGKLFFSPQLKLYSYKNSGPSKTSSGTPLTTTAKSGMLVNLLGNVGYNFINRPSLKWGIMLNGGAMIATKESITLTTSDGQQYDADYSKKALKLTAGIQTRLMLKNKISVFTSYAIPARTSYFYGPYNNVQLGGGLVF